eukprot:5444640-Heterocapsa_arctica.AAC.1
MPRTGWSGPRARRRSAARMQSAKASSSTAAPGVPRSAPRSCSCTSLSLRGFSCNQLASSSGCRE